MNAVGSWAAMVTGFVVVIAVWSSVVRTLIVPRGLRSLTSLVDSGIHHIMLGIARRFRRYSARDTLLTYEAPIRLLSLLGAWLMLAMVGFSLIFLPFATSWPDALARSGSSMFTLGIVETHGGAPVAMSFLAAATGLILVALQIAYLPSLYSAYNRRETLVSMLSSRAGEPPWGPELLARLQLVHNTGDLHHFFREWEMWAADVAESHTNYPILMCFRSPRPLRSWLVGLVAVLDAAAMYLATCPVAAPGDARLCLRMGYVCLREIATVLGIPFTADPLPSDPISLTFEQFAAGVDTVARVGFPLERTAAEAWADFRGWRVNYESVVYRLADQLNAPPALWSGPRRRLEGLPMAPQRPPHREPERAAAGAGASS